LFALAARMSWALEKRLMTACSLLMAYRPRGLPDRRRIRPALQG